MDQIIIELWLETCGKVLIQRQWTSDNDINIENWIVTVITRFRTVLFDTVVKVLNIIIWKMSFRTVLFDTVVKVLKHS